MAVYVDDARIPYRGMLMSHLVADTTEELFAMVDAIGVRRVWIQHPGTPTEHFDIADSKRELAIKKGARPVSTREMVEIIRGRRGGVEGVR